MTKTIPSMLGLLLLVACHAPDNKATSDYFNLSRLVDGQVELLGSATLEVKKNVVVNDQQDEISLTLDSAALREELSIFKAFDPGKSQFTNAFDVVEDGNKTTYVIKENETQALQWVKIEGSSPDRISAEIIEETSIYTIRKKMEFQLEKGNMKYYSLEGYQKMLYKDTTFFAMKAIIL